MKHILIFIFALLAFTATAQEVISETQQYVPYQDSLFVLKTTRVVGTGYEGLNDTTVTYSVPTDTAGLVTQLRNSYINAANTASARLRAASPFRTLLNLFNTEKANLATLGYNLDSLLVSQYANAYTGRWRITNQDGSTFLADVIKHPTVPGLLRATGTTGQGNMNIILYGRHFFRITLPGNNIQYLVWDGNSQAQPNYRNPAWLTNPQAIVTSSLVRMVKIQ